MTGRHPSLAELRARVHKGRHREIGNWLARRVARPSAVYGTWAAVRLGLSAHQVTLGATVAGLASAVAIASGDRLGFVLGVLLAHLAFWLDHVDGQVARWRGTAGLDGVYLDYLMHHASTLALGFGLGYGLASRTGDPRWAAAGFAIACGWAFLGLQNDCRYKAFFQRLKAASGSYRVAGGAGGRPSPPMPWPRHGRGMLTWPAFKACEGHVILIALTAMAGLALIAPGVWLASWRWGVRGVALLAPNLGAREDRQGRRRRRGRGGVRPLVPDGRLTGTVATRKVSACPSTCRPPTTCRPCPATSGAGSASSGRGSSSAIATSWPMPTPGSTSWA